MKTGGKTRVKGIYWLWVRIALMGASLAGVSYTIWNLSLPKDPRPQLNFCPTRVSTIALQGRDPVKIQQVGSEWTAHKAGVKSAVANLAVEKWLGEYCFIRAEKLLESPHIPNSATEVIELSYIDGKTEKILSLDEELFYWNGALYRTTQWSVLLKDLKALFR